MVLVLILCILGLCISFFLANQFYEVAIEKGYDHRKYYWFCFWLGLAGWILVCALPDRGNVSISADSDDLPDL